MNIEKITSRQILDSRGWPTLETTVWVDTGVSGTAAVPSGMSTGSHEAHELRDGDKSYDGRSVNQAISNVIGPIAKALKNFDVRDQKTIDETMLKLDGTVNKSKLGANAILSVSIAALRANSALTKQPVYKLIRQVFDMEITGWTRPGVMMNIINGGRHVDNGLKVQEFMILPQGSNASEMIEQGANVYQALKKILSQRGLSTLIGDEGGFAPAMEREEVALDLLMEAIKAAGYEAGKDIKLGLDVAASEFYDQGKDRYMFRDLHGLAPVGMTGVYDEWLAKYPIVTLEDPLAEDDWDNWKLMTDKYKSNLTVIGDDLFATSPERLGRGITTGAANAVLIKPNQVGTVSETMATIELARKAGYVHVISHRSGETNDSFIVDLAFATNARYLKAGALARGERLAKYNRYLEIDRELNA